MPVIFRRRRAREAPDPSNPAAIEVERILGLRAPPEPLLTAGAPLRVDRALWICACISLEDAPRWLLHDGHPRGFAWQRVPDGVEPLTLVHATASTGGHADPSRVLAWLRGQDSDPWGFPGESVGVGDDGVLDVLRDRITRGDDLIP